MGEDLGDEQGGELYTPTKTEIKAIRKRDEFITQIVFDKVKDKHKEILAGLGLTGRDLETESINRANKQMEPYY